MDTEKKEELKTGVNLLKNNLASVEELMKILENPLVCSKAKNAITDQITNLIFDQIESSFNLLKLTENNVPVKIPPKEEIKTPKPRIKS